MASFVLAPGRAGWPGIGTAWWGATGALKAREQAATHRGYATEFDVGTFFLHDVPTEVLRAGPEQPREEAETVFGEPCRFERWPDILIHVLPGRDDRFFPIEFQRRVARERLGKEVEEIPGGHLVALSNAEGLTERLLAYEKGLTSSSPSPWPTMRFVVLSNTSAARFRQ